MPIDEMERAGVIAQRVVSTHICWLDAASERAFSEVVSAAVVSVVIPTRHRSRLVERAVKSALSQSLHEIEVIVVIDGSDPATEEVLRGLHDERLRVLPLAENVGGAEARNIGVRFSRGKWIALLDDDDEWLPGKLAAQWDIAKSMNSRYAIVASRFIERNGEVDRVLPLRIPDTDEKVSDYLFTRRGWRSGEGFVQTSTWFVSRDLILRVPFTRGLRRCQDLDWLLHASVLPNVEVRISSEVFAIFHHDDGRKRVSREADWRFLYAWANANCGYFTPRAFSFFMATICVPGAAKQREGASTFLFLLRSCVTRGEPTMKCMILFLMCWYIPEAHRRDLRAKLDKLRDYRYRMFTVRRRHSQPEKATL